MPNQQSLYFLQQTCLNGPFPAALPPPKAPTPAELPPSTGLPPIAPPSLTGLHSPPPQIASLYRSRLAPLRIMGNTKWLSVNCSNGYVLNLLHSICFTYEVNRIFLRALVALFGSQKWNVKLKKTKMTRFFGVRRIRQETNMFCEWVRIKTELINTLWLIRREKTMKHMSHIIKSNG